MNSLGPFPKTNHGSQYKRVMKNWYFKLTRAIPSSKAWSTHITIIFFNYRIILFGLLNYMLTDNVTQFASRSFTFICGYLSTKHLKTMTYRPHTYRRADNLVELSSHASGTTSPNTNKIEFCMYTPLVRVQHANLSVGKHFTVHSSTKPSSTKTITYACIIVQNE